MRHTIVDAGIFFQDDEEKAFVTVCNSNENGVIAFDNPQQALKDFVDSRIIDKFIESSINKDDNYEIIWRLLPTVFAVEQKIKLGSGDESKLTPDDYDEIKNFFYVKARLIVNKL